MQKNIISQNEQTPLYCLECGSEMKQFFLPLYNYENQFCERCEMMIMKVNVIVMGNS